MRKLYAFNWDCGRLGDLQGLFIADDADVDKIIGKEVYFGEVLGKHSEIFGEVGGDDLTVKSDDQDFITKFVQIMGEGTISGYSPLDYSDGEDESE